MHRQHLEQGPGRPRHPPEAADNPPRPQGPPTEPTQNTDPQTLGLNKMVAILSHLGLRVCYAIIIGNWFVKCPVKHPKVEPHADSSRREDT